MLQAVTLLGGGDHKRDRGGAEQDRVGEFVGGVSATLCDGRMAPSPALALLARPYLERSSRTHPRNALRRLVRLFRCAPLACSAAPAASLASGLRERCHAARRLGRSRRRGPPRPGLPIREREIIRGPSLARVAHATSFVKRQLTDSPARLRYASPGAQVGERCNAASHYDRHCPR